MEIIIGKSAGFCYGVKRAVESSLEDSESTKQPLFCLGELVHNKQVVQELKNKGITFIENIKETKGTTIIRAHGVPNTVYEYCKENNIDIKDYTCPNVLKIHKIAEEYTKKGYYIFLLGSKNHPENIGTISFCGENYSVIEKEEINIKKISTIFDYDEDKESLGQVLDSVQRKKLTKEELDSIFMTTTEELEMINRIKTEQKVMVKEFNERLKNLKEEMSQERLLSENEDFDMFGTLIRDGKKIKKISNKEHREKSRDKLTILDITKNTTKMDYKDKILEIIDNITRAIQKVEIDREISIYKTSSNENLDENEINIFSINSKEELKKALDKEKINLFKINLKKGTNLIGYTNIVFFENTSKTLPIGMNLSDNVIVDLSKVNIKEIRRKPVRIVEFIKGEADILKERIREVNLIEYEVE